MNQVVALNTKPKLTEIMASSHNMDRDQFVTTVKATCMPDRASNEEFAAFLMVAHQHGLNPITREIYAFPKKGGGIQPVVGIDGWMNLMNSHPEMDGVDFEDTHDDKGNLVAIKCSIFRKDRTRPISVTEYMEECKRPSEPWQKWPARMLRHKAAIQCARYAFSFSGIIDQEEAERSPEVITSGEIAPPPPPLVQSTTTTNNDHLGDPEEIVIETPTDVGTILVDAESAIDSCTTDESLELVWSEFEHFQEVLSEADAGILKGLYETKLEALQPQAAE